MHTPLAIAVLALLRERPMHPYEMHQLLRERHVDELIKVTPGSLYHTVDRLARDELLEPVCTEREGRRPERTTYRVTPAGDAVVHDWVAHQLARPQREYPVYPYALTEAHNLSAADAVQALRDRCTALAADLAQLETVLASRTSPQVYRIGGERLAAMLRAELEWTRDLIERIERKDFPWDPWK